MKIAQQKLTCLANQKLWWRYSEIQCSYQQHRQPLTTTDCVPAPATTAVSFVPDEADSISAISTVTVKNTPKRPQKQKKSAFIATNY